MSTEQTLRAGRREWVGLGVLALAFGPACLLDQVDRCSSLDSE